jgi:hypothetical protein
MNDQDEKLLSGDMVDSQLLIRGLLIILIRISPFQTTDLGLYKSEII